MCDADVHVGFGPYYRDLIKVLDHWPDKAVYGIASLSLARAVVDARDRLGLPIVGFDLAGAEMGFPARPCQGVQFHA